MDANVKAVQDRNIKALEEIKAQGPGTYSITYADVYIDKNGNTQIDNNNVFDIVIGDVDENTGVALHGYGGGGRSDNNEEVKNTKESPANAINLFPQGGESFMSERRPNDPASSLVSDIQNVFGLKENCYLPKGYSASARNAIWTGNEYVSKNPTATNFSVVSVEPATDYTSSETFTRAINNFKNNNVTAVVFSGNNLPRDYQEAANNGFPMLNIHYNLLYENGSREKNWGTYHGAGNDLLAACNFYNISSNSFDLSKLPTTYRADGINYNVTYDISINDGKGNFVPISIQEAQKIIGGNPIINTNQNINSDGDISIDPLTFELARQCLNRANQILDGMITTNNMDQSFLTRLDKGTTFNTASFKSNWQTGCANLYSRVTNVIEAISVADATQANLFDKFKGMDLVGLYTATATSTQSTTPIQTQTQDATTQSIESNLINIKDTIGSTAVGSAIDNKHTEVTPLTSTTLTNTTTTKQPVYYGNGDSSSNRGSSSGGSSNYSGGSSSSENTQTQKPEKKPVETKPTEPTQTETKPQEQVQVKDEELEKYEQEELEIEKEKLEIEKERLELEKQRLEYERNKEPVNIENNNINNNVYNAPSSTSGGSTSKPSVSRPSTNTTPSVNNTPTVNTPVIENTPSIEDTPVVELPPVENNDNFFVTPGGLDTPEIPNVEVISPIENIKPTEIPTPTPTVTKKDNTTNVLGIIAGSAAVGAASYGAYKLTKKKEENEEY